MRKLVVILLSLVGFVLMSTNAQAQAFFANYTTDKVVVASENGQTEVVVNPKSKAIVTFLPSDGIASFTLYKYEGMKKVKVGTLQRRVTKKTVYLKDFSPEAEPEEEKKEKEREKIKAEVISGSSGPGKSAQVLSYDEEWWSETTVVPSNETSYRITVLTAPFKGLSLKSEQASKKAKTLPTGICEFVIYYDEEVDSISTGRVYNWAVFNKIIAEDQDTLKITDYDLKQVTVGKQINVPIVNKFESDLYITAGPNSGKVIPAKGMTKLDLQVGWNVLSVQSLKNGLPVQAIALFMVSEKKKSLSLNKGKNTNSIDWNDMVILSR